MATLKGEFGTLTDFNNLVNVPITTDSIYIPSLVFMCNLNNGISLDSNAHVMYSLPGYTFNIDVTQDLKLNANINYFLPVLDISILSEIEEGKITYASYYLPTFNYIVTTGPIDVDFIINVD